jgi:hypothetical protein
MRWYGSDAASFEKFETGEVGEEVGANVSGESVVPARYDPIAWAAELRGLLRRGG